MRLSAQGGRVLGSLVEKALTTPQQYPLTLNAVVGACSQTSNREPVVDYDESVVTTALDELKELRLVRYVLPSHGRSVVRYRHVLEEIFGLDTRRCALLGVLLLRGPQTAGELRLRTDRMAEFDGLDEVTRELEVLAALAEPLARNTGRRPGQKEERWVTPLLAPEEGHGPIRGDHSGSNEATHEGTPVGAPGRLTLGDRLDDVASDLANLRVEVGQLRQELQTLRANLGD